MKKHIIILLLLGCSNSFTMDQVIINQPDEFLKVRDSYLAQLPPEIDEPLAKLAQVKHLPLLHYYDTTFITDECFSTYEGYGAQLNPEEDRVVTLSDKGTEIWDGESGKHLITVPCVKGATSYHFLSTGDRITKIDGKEVKIFNVAGTLVTTLSGHAGCVNSIELSSDGSKMVTASTDDTVRVWNSETGDCLSQHRFSSEAKSARFNSEANKVAVMILAEKCNYDYPNAYDPAFVAIWDVASDSCIRLSHRNDEISAASFNVKGDRVMTAAGNSVIIWNSENGECLQRIDTEEENIAAAQLNDDGTKLVMVSYYYNDGDDISCFTIWDISGERNRLLGKLERVEQQRDDSRKFTVQFNSAGNKVIVSDYNSSLIWDFYGPELREFLQRPRTFSEIFLLTCIYETMVARRLYAIHGKKALTKEGISKPEDICLNLSRQNPHLNGVYRSLP